MKRPPRPRLARLLAAVAAVTLTACGASGRPAPAVTAGRQGVVLMRTYYLALRPDVKLGKAHPSLTSFGYAGLIPGGQDGKSQLAALSQRFETELGFQFSDTTAIQPGHDATLGMGFGEQIQVTIGNLAPAAGGILEANFGFRFGKREVLKRTLPFKPDEAVLFAGHLDASLPILSVFTLEIKGRRRMIGVNRSALTP